METITEEQLKSQLDAYGNVRHQLESLKANKKTTIEQILAKYPEAKQEIEDAEEELDLQIETAEKTEKSMKKIVDKTLAQYAGGIVIKDKVTLKTDLVTVSITKGKVVYNPDVLDGFALNDPRLLSARTEEPPSTRVMLNK